MPTLSLNGVTNLGNVHAETLNVINSAGTAYDDIKTLITAAGAGAVTSATSPLTIASGVMAINLTPYATTATVNTAITTAINTYATTDAASLITALNLKQNILVAGTSITIVGNTISFDNTLYFTATQIAVALTAYATTASVNTLIADYSTTASLNTALALKQNTLVAGTSITIAGNTINFDSALYWTSAQITTILLAYVTTASLNTLIATYSTTAQMNTLLNTYSTIAQMNAALTVAQNTLNTAIGLKQNTLIAGNGIFKNGSTLTSYGLYYNSGNTVATGITELRWDSAYSVNRTVDLANGVVSLDIGLPTIPDNATISMLNAGLALKADTSAMTSALALKADTSAMTSALATKQATLSAGSNISIVGSTISAPTPTTISNLVSATSGLSLGSSNWPNSVRLHRLACYEASNSNHFYGIGLHSHNTTGLALWSSTGASVPYSDSTSSAGVQPHMFILPSGSVGIGTLAPSQKLHVIGSITCLSVIQTSDKSIKDNIQDASLDDLQEIFDSSEVKTYTRNDDVEGKRYGFIAQEIQSKLPTDIENIVFETRAPTPEGEDPGDMLLALDYSRLAATVLWGVCKKQQRAIEDLSLRLDALENATP
jgi:hypothetical protein